ncbi:hypothetical protein F5144DRAFT_590102 [Chaetomium tenue]|uniref:Uncharacterized protein n=1 Tax=Chaetomium tenue TaxID=1854479 RepID=A0ACB7PKT1_9PEZI|nr:hypothetical protein F5144DRAFT_590102 [Chaetomium globosum]
MYSTLDEEDFEPIGETSTQDGSQGSSRAPHHAWLNTNTTRAGTHADRHAGDSEDPHLFSPTDGYFGTATGSSLGTVVPASSQVPHVPNVLVDDPSLQRSSSEGKAEEAEQERLDSAQGASDPDNGHTSVYPSYTARASRNGGSTGYTTTPTRQSTAASSSQSGATHYTPSSSTHIPRVSSPTSYTIYSPRGPVHRDHFPFTPTEAPPAYTPSPTSPSNTRGFGNYQTFSQARDVAVNMGRPEETQGLLTQPESMRDHNSHGLDEETPTWRGRMRRARRHVDLGCCKNVLIAVVLLFLTTGFLTGVISSTRGNTGRQPPTVDKPGNKPNKPNMNYPDLDGDVRWDPAQLCQDAKIDRHKQTYGIEFGTSKDLRVVEKSNGDDHPGWNWVHVQGSVILRRAGPDTESSAVTVETIVTDDRLRVYSSWDAEAGSLEVIVPRRVEWAPERPRACVNFKITVWVPEGSALRHLTADVEHLDIKLLDNLSLVVGTITSASTGSTSLDDDNNNNNNNNNNNHNLRDEAVSHPPPTYRFHSRLIDVRTTSAPINGAWPLYDYLGLQSTSGDIRVAINPHGADPDTPKPATLYIKSLSGDVDFREPIHAASGTFRIGQALSGAGDRRRALAQAEAQLPPREYRVDVHTSSGDIVGAAAFGAASGFRSTSGTISLELLPVLDARLAEVGGRQVELSTSSTSGATDVKVLEPLWVDDLGLASARVQGKGVRRGYVGMETQDVAATGGGKEKPLRCLSGKHTSTSANIKLRYPGSWEGDIGLATLTGALQVGGEGVKLIKTGSDWPGVNKMVLARKGEKGQGGKVQGKTTSGDVDTWVGEE